MIRERRWGFVLTGALIMGPGLLLGSLVALVKDANFDCTNNCGAGTGTLIALGGIEAIGAAFLTVGLVGHDVPAPDPPDRNLTFLPFVTPQAEGLSVLMHW